MNVAIIGGGACGLVLASILEEKKISYTLFEKSLCGRKILASGNGKANIGNIHLSPECYHKKSLAYELVKSFQPKLFAYFKKINLYTKVDEEGRIYPLTESSQTVLDCIGASKKHILENFPVHSITKMKEKYYINDVRGPFDMVVCTTGSFASFIQKKQHGFYEYLNSLKVKIVPPTPSLVGFRSNLPLRSLAGVRVKCNARLLQENHLIYEERGEIIFKADGISGICILNLSSYYAHLQNKKNCVVSLDLIPNIDVKLQSKKDLIGLLHPKLVAYMQSKSLVEIEQIVHHFEVPILGTYDFEFSQVVCGGVSLEEINTDLQLLKDPHLYLGGEVLDVDGLCGGYNLMFAFCCALKIGEVLCDIKSIK